MDRNETKECVSCKIEKNIEDFPLFGSVDGGRKNTCKECNKVLYEIRKQLKKENPKPDSGICPICEKFTTSWVLDHCHFDNKFRGYICNNCNIGLGRFNDDIEIIKRAIEYLKNYKKD